MRTLLRSVALITGLTLASANAIAAGFTEVRASTRIAADSEIRETVWTAKVGAGEYDQVGLHRFQAPGANGSALLYLPGTNMNGELAVMEEKHNLWLYLANRGTPVFTIDYRTHFVPNETTPDLGFMQDWNLAAFHSDIVLAIEHVARLSGKPVVVAGFSRGVTYAYLVAGHEDVAGIVALDGSFKQALPKPFDRAAAMEKLAASGEWGTILSRGRGWENRAELMRRTWQDPAGPAIGNFDTIGDQLSSVLYNAWGPGGLANPVDGVSSVAVLAKAMEGYDRFFPAIQNVEGRAISSVVDDPATAIDDHFGSIDIPILYFGATNLGPDNLINGIYSAAHSGSKDVEIHVLENHGHVDVLFGNSVSDDVFEVILGFLRDRAEAAP